jgi:hypothetical protein
MITEFKSGIFTAHFQNFDWYIKEGNKLIGFINKEGLLMYFVENISYHGASVLRSIADLMDSVYKQNIQLTEIKSNDN